MTPVLKFSRPSESTSSSATTPTQTFRGRAAMRSPRRRQAPSGSLGSDGSKRGMNGKKTQRPKIASNAGSTVSIVSIATAMPSAPIGPSPDVPLTFASVRHSSAAMTVMPEAKIAGPAVRRAIANASWRSAWRRSSSR